MRQRADAPAPAVRALRPKPDAVLSGPNTRKRAAEARPFGSEPLHCGSGLPARGLLCVPYARNLVLRFALAPVTWLMPLHALPA